MSTVLEELSQDYRKFDEDTSPYNISHRVLTPVFRIEEKDNQYSGCLGVNIKSNGEEIFYPCLTPFHNWILDGHRIKPLPFDAPEILMEAMSGSDFDNIKFPKILSIYRDGIENIKVVISPEVFDKANTRSLSKTFISELDKLNGSLYPYQEQGVAWMDDALKSIGGVILADEMGLGKTLQIIAILLLNEPSNSSPALIVCPTTLIANWGREIEKFAPCLSFLVHRGANRTGFYKDLMRSQVVITTYDMVVNDISMFRGVDWSYLICDEAQAVKNPAAKRRKVLDELTREYTIPVTGTPMENSLMDLWSLGDLAIPGILWDKDTFSSLYPDSDIGAEDLSVIVDTFILKRQVKDVAKDLPERTNIDFPLVLGEEASHEYDRIRETVIAEYGPVGRLVAVGQLALYCAHPWLRIKDINDPNWEEKVELQQDPAYHLFTIKMEACINILRESFLTGKKVLIFATYNHCAELIQRAAQQGKLVSAYWNTINGSTAQQLRQAIVDEFSSIDGPGVLILNPKAAGSGLNITAATIVIHYTQNWNPALEMQASARAHRRGQTQPVTVYRLFYKGTVEETMVERSEWKRGMGEVAIPLSSIDSESLAKALSMTSSET